MDELVVITLFRHGVTDDNMRKVYCGWTDTPLSPRYNYGLQPCSENAGLYFSSDLTRCKQTFSKLFPNKAPILLSELREMNFGEWEGKSYLDLKDVLEYRDWISNPFSVKPPNGENFNEFSKRVEKGWDRIIKQLLQAQGNRAAVVTHGGVIRYLLTQFAPDQKPFWNWNVSHEKAYELIFDNEALRRGKRCILLREVPLTVNGDG